MTTELFGALKRGDWFRLAGGNTVFRKENETLAIEHRGRRKFSIVVAPDVMVTWIPNLRSR